jgi:hypothetical protein
LLSTPGNRRGGGPSGSFVEGDSYDSTIDEIEAMGGDPSFLDGYAGAAGDGDDGSASPRDSSDGDGDGDGGWEVDVEEGWNGVVDDNAHFDFD